MDATARRPAPLGPLLLLLLLLLLLPLQVLAVAVDRRGRIWRQGRTLHYYWTGDWLIYSSEGSLQHVESYELGKLVRTRTSPHQSPVPVRGTTYAHP